MLRRLPPNDCRAAAAIALSQIVTDGRPQEHVYKVVSGKVRVEKGDSTTPVGQGAVVNQIGEMQTFGEMSFLDSRLPCANCIADSEEVDLLRVPKLALAERLNSDPELARDFYKYMAISVTQRLALVSSASAEIPEAPRGFAQPMGAAVELSAAKLLKVRRRLNVSDTVSMACMMKTAMVMGKNRKHGTMYVFETLIGLVTKVFGLKQHESYAFSAISEVLRESLTLKKEDNGIEIVLTNGKTLTFYPAHVDEAYEAIYRCRAQYLNEHQDGAAPTTAAGAEPEPTPRAGRTGRRGSALVNPDLAFALNPHAPSADPQMSGGGRTPQVSSIAYDGH